MNNKIKRKENHRYIYKITKLCELIFLGLISLEQDVPSKIDKIDLPTVKTGSKGLKHHF